MISDSEIKAAGVQALVDALGDVEAERFIALIQRESFDYTEWQKTLWPGKSVQEISDAAMKFRETLEARDE